MSSRIAHTTMAEAIEKAKAAEELAQMGLKMLSDSAFLSIDAALEAIPNATGEPACLDTAKGTAKTSAELLKAAIRTTLQRADSAADNPISAEAVRLQAQLSKVVMKLAQLPPTMAQVLLGMEAVTRSASATQAVCAPMPAKHSLQAVIKATALQTAVQSSGNPSACAYGLGGMLAAVSVCVTEGAMALKMTPGEALSQFRDRRRYDTFGRNEIYDSLPAPTPGTGTTSPSSAPGSSGTASGTGMGGTSAGAATGAGSAGSV